MIEKLKDFFFDSSDTLLSLFIILIMALTITWKLSGAMNMPFLNNTTDILNIGKAQPATHIEKNISSNNEETPQQGINQETPTNSGDGITIIPEDARDIKVEIPRGATGNSIAKILKEQDLINSTSEFINRVEELNLGPKLRFGTFTIKSDSSVDQIISIITGITGN